MTNRPDIPTSRDPKPGCTHLDTIATTQADGDGCSDCIVIGSTWVHLRRCTHCGHVGCCDNSPNRHATAHHRGTGHPIIQSFEPGEDWYWCYPDTLLFDLPGRHPSISHP